MSTHPTPVGGPVWRICQTCKMPYQDTAPARLAHQYVKGHHAVDAGPWSDPEATQ